MAGHGIVRLYARVALVGFWSLLVGVVAVLVAARLLPLANGESTAPESSSVRLSIAPMIVAGLGGLFDAGLASVVVGGLLLFFGIRLTASASPV